MRPIRNLQATSLHQPVGRVHVEADEILHETSAQALGRALKHRRFESARRHGKYLLAAVEDGKWLVMHFGMTGELKYYGRDGEAPEYTGLLLAFENGDHLAYVAPRKLGRIALAESPESWSEKQELGPDALEISREEFEEMAESQRGGVKSWLMNQKRIAGIGNVYSDEILFQAGIDPRRKVEDLDPDECKTLFDAMRSVLQKAIDARADPAQMPDSFLLPQRHEDGHCPECDSPLENSTVNGRSSWYCPKCQN